MNKSNIQQIVINPELIPNIIKNSEHDLFCIWNAAKQIDFENTGIVNQSDFIDIAIKIFGFNKTYIYSKINKGVNLYWRLPYGKKGVKKIALLGINQIIKRLQPSVTRSKPVVIPNSIFFNQTSKSIKNLFIGIFAARYEDQRPISIETICKYTSLSESSVRNSLKDCPFINTKSNYEVIFESYSKPELLKIFKQQNNCFSLRILEKNNKYTLLKQISNSYILNSMDRIPCRYRPKELRRIDKILLDKISSRLYDISDNNISVNNHSILSCYR
jgi:hypothetical protein